MGRKITSDESSAEMDSCTHYCNSSGTEFILRGSYILVSKQSSSHHQSSPQKQKKNKNKRNQHHGHSTTGSSSTNNNNNNTRQIISSTSLSTRHRTALRSSTSWSSNNDDIQEIKRTSSAGGSGVGGVGGFGFFLRSRSVADQENISRARAVQMCAAFESCTRDDDSLQKQQQEQERGSVFRTSTTTASRFTPTFTKPMTAQQAKVYAAPNTNKRVPRQCHTEQRDPLTPIDGFASLQINSKHHCSIVNPLENTVSSKQVQFLSSKNRKPNRIMVDSRNDSQSDEESEKDMVVTTPGNASVEETVIMDTPSPVSFCTSNGQIYRVPNFC